MLPLIAVPVVHAAGGWIAATSAAGYIGGTLSATWAGAFIAGNAAVLSGIGIGIAGYAAATTTALSGAATSVGVSLGIIPATFLGLTPVGWAIAGTVTAVVAGSTATLYYKSTKVRRAIDSVLVEINAERIKGGLEPFGNAFALIKSLRK